MDDILRDLGLSEHTEEFTLNAITPSIVLHLTDEEFRSLGITSIGDKVRLRERCRDHTRFYVTSTAKVIYGREKLRKTEKTVAENEGSSPVLKRLKCLRDARKGRSKRKLSSNIRKPKETRRITLGWKHFSRNSYTLMKMNKGGGTLNIDVNKTATMDEILTMITEKYFPNGINSTTQLLLVNLDYYIATFTGTAVRDKLKSGNPFTLGGFIDEMGSSPIRLYLHTKENSQVEAAPDEIDNGTQLPDLSDEDHQSSGTQTVTSQESQCVEASDNETGNGIIVYDSDDDFEPSGTPTVTFRRTRLTRLRLRCAPVPTSSAPPTESSTSNSSVPPTASSTSNSSVPPTASSASAPPSEFNASVPSSAPNTAVSPSTPNASAPPTASSASAPPSESSASVPPSVSNTSVPPFASNASATPSSSTSSAMLLTDSTSHSPTAIDSPIVDNEEDDQFLQTAIQESLEMLKADFTLEGVLKWWCEETLTSDDPQVLLIYREKVLSSSLRIMRRDNFKYTAPFKVSFSGEDGDDLGGPKREYFRLLMSEVQDNILEGKEGNKFFRHDIAKLESGQYEMAGKLVAFCILHGGPGLPVFNATLYNIMTDQEVKDFPCIENCIFDYDIKSQLEAIEQATTEDEYRSAVDDCADWCLDQGLTVTKYRSLSERDKLKRLLILNVIYYRVHSEITQFKKGMNYVGSFYDNVLRNPDALKSLFVTENNKLTFGSLRKMYTVDFSEEGSNYRTCEQQALYCLEAFLADCEGGATGVDLPEVLVFWTGASSVPPLGFDKKLEISFSSVRQLPTAHTCGMVLKIWRGYSDPDEFAAEFEKAIRWGGGFHLA